MARDGSRPERVVTPSSSGRSAPIPASARLLDSIASKDPSRASSAAGSTLNSKGSGVAGFGSAVSPSTAGRSGLRSKLSVHGPFHAASSSGGGSGAGVHPSGAITVGGRSVQGSAGCASAPAVSVELPD